MLNSTLFAYSDLDGKNLKKIPVDMISQISNIKDNIFGLAIEHGDNFSQTKLIRANNQQVRDTWSQMFDQLNNPSTISKPLMKGTLRKKRRYSRRSISTTFELDKTSLNFVGVDGQSKEILLHNCRISETEKSDNKFIIQDGGRTHEFEASDSAQKKEWISKLNIVIDHHQEGEVSFSPDQPFGITWTNNTVTAVAPNSQAAKAKVEVGSVIFKINGKKQSKDPKKINKVITELKKENKKVMITFLKPK